MGYDNNEKKFVPVYEKKIRAGKKRTYFFDIKETRNSGFSLVITESRKRFDDRGFDRTSIYVYQEDINKFAKGLVEAVDFIKTELLPNYDFDQYNNDYDELPENYESNEQENRIIIEDKVEKKSVLETAPTKNVNQSNIPNTPLSFNDEFVDKW